MTGYEKEILPDLTDDQGVNMLIKSCSVLWVLVGLRGSWLFFGSILWILVQLWGFQVISEVHVLLGHSNYRSILVGKKISRLNNLDTSPELIHHNF